MTQCVFCLIVAGQIPASRVFEDDRLLAFMDIRPVRPGQVLIVPKGHVDHFSDVPDELAARILLLGQRLARTMRRTLAPTRVGLAVHGFGVGHAHLIVLPLENPWDLTSAQFSYIEGGEVRFRWEAVGLATREDLDGMATRLRAGLEASETP